MTKVRRTYFNIYNKVLGLILAVLGFSTACKHGGEEYGVPTATFRISGQVTADSTQNAISNIQVSSDYDTVYTDDSGNYTIELEEYPDDQTFTVEFKDVDGVENGEYETLDTIVEFKDPEFSGGSGSWDSGVAEKEVNINLKEK
jgi:putative lipoprotein (rSAM/lipoprotein system)